MQKLIYILCFTFISLGSVKAQNADYWNPEQKTYVLWQQKNWKELIYWGKKAVKEGNDYFYLRMRLGAAFYEKKNYHRALISFQKALKYNDKDPTLLEYLYYANLFSGREKAALDISKHFSAETQNKLKISFRQKFGIRDFGAQYLIGNKNLDPALFSEITDPLLDGSQHFTKVAFRAHLGFNHWLSRRFNLIYRYGFLVENRYTYYQKDQQVYLFPNHYLYQHQFYIQGNQYLGKGFNLAASLQYLPGKIPGYSSGFGMFGSYVPDYKYNDFASSLIVTKDIPYFRLNAGAVYSFLNYQNYMQEETGFTFFPLGNLNLYFGGGYHWQQKFKSKAVIQKGSFVNYSAGFKLFYPVWLEYNASSGNLQYTVSQNGWQVLNDSNCINFQQGIKIITALKAGKILLSLSYYHINLDSLFQSESDSFFPFNTKNYYINSIYGGLSWQL